MDGGQLGAPLEPANTASGVRADTACRSKANLDLLDRRGLRLQFQWAKPRGLSLVEARLRHRRATHRPRGPLHQPRRVAKEPCIGGQPWRIMPIGLHD